MPKRKTMNPDDTARSAENQLIDLKKAQTNKIEALMQKREAIVNQSRTVQTIAYEIGNAFKTVFPGAKGFIELRIKTPNSITTKARNEFTEILNELSERNEKVEDGKDQKKIIDKIRRIDFKDILAFSVVTTVPPEQFKTGNDELNERLTKLAKELGDTQKRLDKHKEYIQYDKENMVNFSKEIIDLREKLITAMSREEKEQKIEELTSQILFANSNEKIARQLLSELTQVATEDDKETIKATINDKTKQFNNAKEHLEYEEVNLSRTTGTYMSTLRELQYQMSSYFVSNLTKFSTFMYWGAKEIRQPKEIVKPGFRTMNTGYSVAFSDDSNGQFSLDFEVQGKGKLDYDDAEFSALGALYHEEQKTKDGLISKKTEMPDFTIIGAEPTARIEREVRLKYQDISSPEDLLNSTSDDIVGENYKFLKDYEEKIKKQFQEEYGDNLLSKEKSNEKLRNAFNTFKENLIQDEVEAEIDRQIDSFADTDKVKQRIQEKEELTEEYNRETKRLESNNATGLTQEEIEHRARVRVLYFAKEREIAKLAENSIPIFSRADLSSSVDDEVMIYTFTTGESIYRYYINKLNGLKDENGKYRFEPQEQQKRALLKLTGLFEEKDTNFYTYYKDEETFGGLGYTDNTDDGERD